MINREQALGIAKEFAVEINELFEGRITAVFAIGSLGGDYYRPGQSDIDTFIIIDDINRQPYEQVIGSIADKYTRHCNIPKSFGAVVACKQDLYPPYIKTDELVLEIINLKSQGLLIHGAFDTSEIPMPDRRAIVEDANAFEDWRGSVASESDELLLTRQESTNSILILLKRYLLIEKGIMEFNKLKVVDAYLSCNPPIISMEVFALIQKYLVNIDSGKDTVITGEQLSEMNRFHIYLKRYMNQMLLSR